MSHLLDTGILLRVADRHDSQHATVRAAVRTLISEGDSLHITTQNSSAFQRYQTEGIHIVAPASVIARGP